MRRLLAAVVLVSFVFVGTSSAAEAPIIRAASSGKVFRLTKGDSATLRLSNQWRWSEPRVSTDVVELTPVEYFVDPGFREWTIDARKVGRATIRSIGRPRCAPCGLETRRFVVTIVVTTP